MEIYNVVTIAILMLLLTSSTQPASDIANMRLQKLFDTSYSKDRVPVLQDGKPIAVLLSLHLRELMLKEADMIMSLDSVDVIQSWTDSRLAAVTHDTRDLDLNKSQIEKVWKPDVHVVKGRHQMLADHKTLTVSKSGLVTFHQRRLRRLASTSVFTLYCECRTSHDTTFVTS